MSTTALYRALIEAGASENTALEATHGMENEFITRSYLDERLNALEARLSEKLTWRMILIAAIFNGLTIAAVGFMLRGLPGVSG